MEKNTKELTLLRGASLANRTRSQVKEELQKMSEIFGEKCIGSFAKLGLNGSWLKTCQGSCQVSLAGTLEEYSETWPKQGIVSSGFAYQLQPLELGIKGTESGLLPTLGAQEGRGASKKRYKGSKEYRGGKMVEGLRVGPECPQYLHPEFAEQAMGFPKGWTELKDAETQ